jgi:hypothetical protein
MERACIIIAGAVAFAVVVLVLVKVLERLNLL